MTAGMDIFEAYRLGDRSLGQLITTASVEELTRLRVLVSDDIRSIDNQLRDAEDRVATSGRRSDRDWYNRASGARSAKGHLITQIQAQLTLLNEARRAVNREQNETSNKTSKLIEAMRLVLTPEQVEAVLERWKQIR